MHDVQTRMRLPAPFTKARTDCRLRFQRRLVTLWAWLMRLPNWGPRPQISQTLAIKQKSPDESKDNYTNVLCFEASRVGRTSVSVVCERLLQFLQLLLDLRSILGVGRHIQVLRVRVVGGPLVLQLLLYFAQLQPRFGVAFVILRGALEASGRGHIAMFVEVEIARRNLLHRLQRIEGNVFLGNRVVLFRRHIFFVGSLRLPAILLQFALWRLGRRSRQRRRSHLLRTQTGTHRHQRNPTDHIPILLKWQALSPGASG